MDAHWLRGCHALSQVTNHAPNKPMITPTRGLETANQKGITSLNEMTSRATGAVSKIVFIPCSLLFDSVAAIARVLDFGAAMAGLFRVVGFTTFAVLRRFERGMAVSLER